MNDLFAILANKLVTSNLETDFQQNDYDTLNLLIQNPSLDFAIQCTNEHIINKNLCKRSDILLGR
jgi:hypothetical protein